MIVFRLREPKSVTSPFLLHDMIRWLTLPLLGFSLSTWLCAFPRITTGARAESGHIWAAAPHSRLPRCQNNKQTHDLAQQGAADTQVAFGSRAGNVCFKPHCVNRALWQHHNKQASKRKRQVTVKEMTIYRDNDHRADPILPPLDIND